MTSLNAIALILSQSSCTQQRVCLCSPHTHRADRSVSHCSQRVVHESLAPSRLCPLQSSRASRDPRGERGGCTACRAADGAQPAADDLSQLRLSELPLLGTLPLSDGDLLYLFSCCPELKRCMLSSAARNKGWDGGGLSLLPKAPAQQICHSSYKLSLAD
jgi:hypothetical protein